MHPRRVAADLEHADRSCTHHKECSQAKGGTNRMQVTPSYEQMRRLGRCRVEPRVLKPSIRREDYDQRYRHYSNKQKPADEERRSMPARPPDKGGTSSDGSETDLHHGRPAVARMPLREGIRCAGGKPRRVLDCVDIDRRAGEQARAKHCDKCENHVYRQTVPAHASCRTFAFTASRGVVRRKALSGNASLSFI